MSPKDLKFDVYGLIPAIVQDASTNEVRMLGFMNEETLRQTLKTGLVTFWSRSRQDVWVKGSGSGNFLKLTEVRVNCHNDSLLILANPIGPTCHTGAQSCYLKPDGTPRLLAIE